MTQDPKTGVRIQVTDTALNNFYLGFGAVQNAVHRLAVAKGFWDVVDTEARPKQELRERNVSEMLMLMVTELAEACEGVRHGNPPSVHIPKFNALEEELADTIIRIMDMAEGMNLRVAQAIIAKFDFNSGRPHKHGKEF